MTLEIEVLNFFRKAALILPDMGDLGPRQFPISIQIVIVDPSCYSQLVFPHA